MGTCGSPSLALLASAPAVLAQKPPLSAYCEHRLPQGQGGTLKMLPGQCSREMSWEGDQGPPGEAGESLNTGPPAQVLELQGPCSEPQRHHPLDMWTLRRWRQTLPRSPHL